jgi:RNA polymerase sigma factor (sigma-70 family)
MFAVNPAVATPPELEPNGDVPFPRQAAPSLASKTIQAQDLALRSLMRSAQAGDPRAYAELLGTITPRLRRIVSNQRRFLQAADVEDLVQEILLSLHAVRGTYDPERPFMPWLLAIAQHRLADAARRYHRHVARKNDFEDMSSTFSEDAPNTDTDFYGDREGLKQAIERLPPRQRTAIQLLKLREMSLKEAAEASGSSTDALKVSVHRAMATLRHLLKR